MIDELADKINKYLNERKRIKDLRKKHFKMRQDNFSHRKNFDEKGNVTLTGTITTNDIDLNGDGYDINKIARSMGATVSRPLEPTPKYIAGLEEIEPGLYTTNYSFSGYEAVMNNHPCRPVEIMSLPDLLPDLHKPLEMDSKTGDASIDMIKDVRQKIVKLKEGKLIVEDDYDDVEDETFVVEVIFMNGETKVFYEAISLEDNTETWALECKSKYKGKYKYIHLVKRNILYMEESVVTE